MESILQDLRYGVRMLLKSPGFTAVAVLTLALGISANTVIFSVINIVLLMPLPYSEPDRLVMLWMDNTKRGIHGEGTSYLNFVDWKTQSQVFTDMAICTSDKPAVLPGAYGLEPVENEFVSANLFSLLGAEPLLGRTFSTDDVERRERVVVLSYKFWQRWFGASPDVIGKTIEINGVNSQIIGVMSADFFFPTKETQLWQPVSSWSRWDREKARRHSDWWSVIGRLKPGVTFQQAQTEMEAISSRLEDEYPTTDPEFAGFGVNLVPLFNQITSTRLQLALWNLMFAIFFVLLIVCTNLANLMLSRGATRRREFAIRLALGAGQARLIRQMLTESAILALGAGLLGLMLAAAGIKSLLAFAPQDIPRLDEIRIDLRVLAFTFGLSLLASILFGLLPAWKVSRINLNESLKEGGRAISRGLSGQHARRLLMMIEVALAVVLMAGAGLLIRSFLQIQAVDPGYNPERVLTMKVNLPESTSPAQIGPFYQQVFERINALPGVKSVGAARQVFLEYNPDFTISVEGHPPVPPSQATEQLMSDVVSPDYFATMMVPLRAGRFFSDQDGPESPRVAVINETMARRFFPEEDPVGKRFSYGDRLRPPFWTIVGVVGDVRVQGLEKEAISQLFIPLAQDPHRNMALVVRTAIDPLEIAGAVRHEMQAIDKRAVLSGITTVERQLEEFNSQRSFQTTLLSIFAVIALTLAAIGIYGVVSHTVTQRRHEIGIRIALGAQRSDILGLVVRQGMDSVLMGLGVGVLAALWITPVLASLLYGISATDPMTFVGIALLLAAVALLACFIPAHRATRVDPMEALRCE